MSDQHDARFIREVAIRYVGARRRCPDAIRESANVATRNGETTDYRAVPVSQEERGFPLVAYVFTGFAPRQFLRLDPR